MVARPTKLSRNNRLGLLVEGHLAPLGSQWRKVHVIYSKMALRQVILLSVTEDATFWVWIVSNGEPFPAELRVVEHAVFRSLSSARGSGAAVTFPSKDVTYLVEKEPGIWARGLVENVFQSSKGCLAKVFFVDYGTRSTLLYTRLMPMPSELETYRHTAQHYSLAGIEAVTTKQSSTWGPNVQSVIHDLSRHSTLLLKNVLSSTSSGVDEAILFTSDSMTNINEFLVNKGLARWRGQATIARTPAAITHEIDTVDRSLPKGETQELDQSTEASSVEYDPSIMVLSPRPLPPMHDLWPLGLPQVMERKLTHKLTISPILAHCWPILLKEENLLGVCPPGGDYRMSYLLPLISLQLKNRTKQTSTISHLVDGPSAVILLLNSHEVDQVHAVVNQLMDHCLPHEKLTHVKCYGGIEAEASLQLLNGCDLLLTTPSSLLRLVNNRKTTLCNLHHLVFDGASILTDSFSDEIKLIIRNYVEVVKENSRLHVLQVVAMTTECTPDVLSLMEAYGRHRAEGYHMIVTCAIEAMVLSKCKLDAAQADHPKKLDHLTQILQRNTTPSTTVMCVASDEEQREVCMFLQRYNFPVLKITNSSDWNSYKGLVPSVQCIVLHDRVLPIDPLDTPPSCQVHYSLPNKVQVFRQRLTMLIKAFKEKETSSEIVVYIDASTTLNQKLSVARLLKRMKQPVPEYLSDSQHSPGTRWSSIQGYDLCYYFCAFGECKMGFRKPCRNLHSLSNLSAPTTGPPYYPTPPDGVVKFKVCHVGNGSRLWVRILEHHPLRRGESPYIPPPSQDILKLATDMSLYFSDKENHRSLAHPKPGDCCVYIDSDNTFQRAQIYGFDREISDFYYHKERAKIRLLDVGSTEVVEVNQLIQLPNQFATQRRQVVECFVCNIRPNDQDKDFSLLALSFVKEKYEGRVLWACVFGVHPGYMWLGAVEEREYLNGTGVFTSLSNWRKELLRRKLAQDNPEHLKQLVAVNKEEETTTEAVPVKLSVGGSYEATVSHVDNINKFHIQLLASSAELDRMYEDLNKETLAAGVFGRVKVNEGDVVAAIFPDDNSWYRGKITGYNPTTRQYNILFIDYGNEEWVNETAIQLISTKLLELPPQAIQCSLEGMENLDSTLAESLGKKLDQLAVDNDFVAKVAFVESCERGQPCHYVNLYTSDGDDITTLLQCETWMGVSRSTLPHPSSSEFGALGTAFLSSPSLSSLADVGLDIVRSKENFQLEEAELQWVVSKLRQIPPELLEPVMNIITSLTYCSHPAMKALTSDLSTEVFHDILKRCSTEVALRLTVLLEHWNFNEITGPLLTEGWIKTLCRLFSVTRDTQTQQAVLYLLNKILTEKSSLIPALILEGGVSTATATLTVLSDSSLQSPTLALLETIVTSEEGQDVCMSSALAKAISVTMETATDVHTLLMALTVVKVMVDKGNPHSTTHVKKSIERLLNHDKSAFLRRMAKLLYSKMTCSDKPTEPDIISIPKPIQKCNLESKPVSTELHPLVLWGQTRDHIELKMELFECKDIQVDFGGNLQELHFKGLSRTQVYTFDVVLYKEVVSESLLKRVTPQRIILRINKKEKPIHWPRLTLENCKVPYLRADFEIYSESDDDDIEDKPNTAIKPVRKIAPSQLKKATPDFKDERTPYDASSSSEDLDDFSDVDDYL